jgi:hypothetical protein
MTHGSFARITSTALGLPVSLELPVTNLDNPVAIGAAMDGAFMTILRNHEPAVKRAFS